MKLSASQAAKEAGVSVMTITRACKSGRLSYESREGGGYSIDPAELFRVFPPKQGESSATPKMLNDATHIDNSVLQVEIQMLRELLADKDKQIADARQERDEWRKQASALLTDQRAKPAPASSWWPFRRANG